MKKFCKKPARIARVARNSINRKGYKKPARIARVANINSKAVLCVKKPARVARIAGKKAKFCQFWQKIGCSLYIPPLLFCARKEEREICQNRQNWA